MHPLTRQSRHPMVVALLVCIMIVGVWQILTGEERHETLWHLPTGTYVFLALVNVVGCMAYVSATVQADAWTATAFELAGAIILCGPLSVYLWSVITTVQYPDTDVVTALLGGTLIGLLLRIWLIMRDVITVVREGLAPPVGDLDLLTADKVNAVADLVTAAHGGLIDEEAAVAEAVASAPRHAQ